MAIQQRVVNGSQTEIYVAGGGNYLTQAAPTNFHRFFKRKVLVGNEKPADYREVTSQQKTQLEQQDAKWVEPPKWFVELWSKACGVWGCYNETTGYFELNGLTDITHEQALDIYYAGAIDTYDCAGKYQNVRGLLRTNLPRKILSKYGYSSQGFIAHNLCLSIEVLNLEPWWGEDPNGFMVDNRFSGGEPSNFYNFADDEWFGSRALKKIIGTISLYFIRPQYWFNALRFCYELTDVKIKDCGCNLELRNAQGLTLFTMSYLIANAKDCSSKSISITVHPDVYSKLTDEANTEWHQVLLDAAAKNINFATV